MSLSLSLSAALLTAVMGSETNPSLDTDGALTQPGRDFLLINPPPYPAGRTDSPNRPENGRLWSTRYRVGTRTPISEGALPLPVVTLLNRYGRGKCGSYGPLYSRAAGSQGPAAFGAPADAADELVLVRTRENLPPVAISPWTPIGEGDIELLKRDQPWLRRQPTILADLQLAQQIWLKEHGYIQAVRTHTNATAQVKHAEATEEIQPRAVIRVTPPEPALSNPALRAESTGEQPKVRISMPSWMSPTKPISVLPAAAPEQPHAQAEPDDATPGG